VRGKINAVCFCHRAVMPVCMFQAQPAGGSVRCCRVPSTTHRPWADQVCLTCVLFARLYLAMFFKAYLGRASVLWRISILRWAILTVLWIGFCHTGPTSLCIDLFVFVCVYFVCFCFILHSCCIIVSTVGWTWLDWSLILKTYLPSVLWHCWLGHLTRKNPFLIWPIMCLVGR